MYSKSLDLEDYTVLAPEIGVFDAARLSFPHRLDHEHRAWEYAMALKALTSTGCKTVLDIGGGGCLLAPMLAGLGFDVTVVDPDAEALAKTTELNIKTIGADFLDAAFEDKSFDAVVAISVIEHVPAFIKFIDKMQRVALKLVVLTTDFSYTGETFVPHHLRTYTPDMLKSLATLNPLWRSPHRPRYDSPFRAVGGDYSFASLVLTPAPVPQQTPDFITFVSICRDSESYLDRYAMQVNQALANLPLSGKRILVVEGDSKDKTPEKLGEIGAHLYGARMSVVKFDMGTPLYGSADIAERWVNLEACWNEAMYHIGESEWVVCVESDLIWDFAALTACMQAVSDGVADVIYPALLTFGRDGHWHDINGFEIDGLRFKNEYPYHPIWDGSQRYLSVQTGGGMIVGKGASFKQAVWRDKCRLHFPDGVRRSVDMLTRIYHPAPRGG